jgi:hypothetical protein
MGFGYRRRWFECDRNVRTISYWHAQGSKLSLKGVIRVEGVLAEHQELLASAIGTSGEYRITSERAEYAVRYIQCFEPRPEKDVGDPSKLQDPDRQMEETGYSDAQLDYTLLCVVPRGVLGLHGVSSQRGNLLA